MAYSINRRPLLREMSDSEFEDDVASENDEPRISIPDDESFVKTTIPLDKYNLAYLVFCLLGITSIIPWSFFMTATEYWMYKFRDVHPNNSGQHNYSHAEILGQKNELQASFVSYLSVASALPNTVFLILNTFLNNRISLTTRMIGSQILILSLFIITTALVKVNTDEMQSTFLSVTLTTVACVNALSAIFGGSLLGVVSRFSPKYITAMSTGQALGGIFTAIAEIASLWVGVSPVISGLLYFLVGDVILFLSLVAYILLERAVFFKHHMLDKPQKAFARDFSVNMEVGFSHNQMISYSRILKRIWPFGLSMFMLFFVTVAVYPAVTVLIESEDKGKGHEWNDVYFVPVVAYLVFSMGDCIGRILSGIFLWPRNKPWLLNLLIVMRVLFVPAFLLCNAQPRHHLPVYIDSDIMYIWLTIFFAISNGYFCNLIFISTLGVVDSHEKEIASIMIGAFLGLGFFFGSPLSMGLVKVL